MRSGSLQLANYGSIAAHGNLRFKRNRTRSVLRDSGHEDPIGTEAVLEDPVILMAQFEACPLN